MTKTRFWSSRIAIMVEGVKNEVERLYIAFKRDGSPLRDKFAYPAGRSRIIKQTCLPTI